MRLEVCSAENREPVEQCPLHIEYPNAWRLPRYFGSEIRTPVRICFDLRAKQFLNFSVSLSPFSPQVAESNTVGTISNRR
jgi:hypothetical protein